MDLSKEELRKLADDLQVENANLKLQLELSLRTNQGLDDINDGLRSYLNQLEVEVEYLRELLGRGSQE